MEAPNPIHKFQPSNKEPAIVSDQSKKDWRHQFELELLNYTKSDATSQAPPSPKKNTQWLSYQGGKAQDIDHAIHQITHSQTDVLLKFQTIDRHHSGLNQLLERLMEPSPVKHLIIRQSSLTQQMIQTIERVLQLNNGIAWLVLDHNALRDHDIAHIANGLSENTNVQHVVLSGNAIGDTGMDDLIRTLKTNHEFKTLFLNKNRISDRSISGIIDGLKSRPPLQIFDIRENALSNAGKKIIAKYCKSVGTICHV